MLFTVLVSVYACTIYIVSLYIPPYDNETLVEINPTIRLLELITGFLIIGDVFIGFIISMHKKTYFLQLIILLDFITCIPIFIGMSSTGRLANFSFLRIWRFVRFLRFFRLFNILSRIHIDHDIRSFNHLD